MILFFINVDLSKLTFAILLFSLFITTISIVVMNEEQYHVHAACRNGDTAIYTCFLRKITTVVKKLE